MKNQLHNFKTRPRIELERSRFHHAYEVFCKEFGLPCECFVEQNGFVFNLFELYHCVEWYGGYKQISQECSWHRIAYVLCRASRKQMNASQAVQSCFLNRLAAFTDRLQSMTVPNHVLNEAKTKPRAFFHSYSARRLRRRPGQQLEQQLARMPRRWTLRTSFDVITHFPLPQTPESKAVIRCIAPPNCSVGEKARLASSSTELPDLIPGDRWRSAVEWLREFARDPSCRMDVEQERYHFRYSGQLLRMRCKLSRHFKRETTKTILMKKLDTEKKDETEGESESDEELEASNGDEVKLGPQHQAEIPECRPLPGEISSRWNPAPITLRESLDPTVGIERPVAMDDSRARLEWMDCCSEMLRKSVGAASGDLGLCQMGACVRSSWTTDQEGCFASGMAKHGRHFEQIKEEVLPKKTCEDLVLYYYNIWKQGRLPAAQEWYREKRQRVLAEEKAEQERQREIKERNRQISAEGRKRRMERKQQKKLEDALQWVRSLAKNPDHTHSVRRHLCFAPAQRMAALYRDGCIQAQCRIEEEAELRSFNL